MTISECSEIDCGEHATARGLCQSHYMQRRYYGTLPAQLPPIRACDVCGEEYQPRIRGSMYCSRRCAGNARYARRVGPVQSGSCDQCGTSLAGKRRKARFCSEKCNSAWRNGLKSEERWSKIRAEREPCVGCGGPMPESLTSRARYCSQPCRIKARRQEAYGLTHEELAVLLAQHEVCAICKTTEWGKKGPQVDHCHATGRVRGVLCSNCNQGLGRFADDPQRLRKAAEYLER